MNPNEYQKAALRTESSDSISEVFNTDVKHIDIVRLLNGAAGLCGESGEVMDLIKKHLFQGHELDKEHVAKELGDVAWYLAVAADAIGYDLEFILKMNIDKLRSRYPGEGFDSERSKHRKVGDI